MTRHAAALQPTFDFVAPARTAPKPAVRLLPTPPSSVSVPVRRAITLDPASGRWRTDAALIAGAVAIHLVVGALWFQGGEPAPLPPKPHQIVELVRPPEVPPQAETPPPPEPPKPLPQKAVAKPQPVARPAPLRTAAADPTPAPADAITIPENTSAPVTSAPVVAAPPAPPAPPAPIDEPVTEAHGNAAYLSNPPPEYPAVAVRQGWEGRVLLRVHVLATGLPDAVELFKPSGRKVLDDAALATVRKWRFVPAQRGRTPIDGWATVPIEFKLAK